MFYICVSLATRPIEIDFVFRIPISMPLNKHGKAF